MGINISSNGMSKSALLLLPGSTDAIANNLLDEKSLELELQILEKNIKEALFKKSELHAVLEQFLKTYNFVLREEKEELYALTAHIEEGYNNLNDSVKDTLSDLYNTYQESCENMFNDAKKKGLFTSKLLNESEEKELKKLYRLLTKKLHPDKNENMTSDDKQKIEEKFKKIAAMKENNDIDGMRNFAQDEGISRGSDQTSSENPSIYHQKTIATYTLDRITKEILDIYATDVYQQYTAWESDADTFREQERILIRGRIDEIKNLGNIFNPIKDETDAG